VSRSFVLDCSVAIAWGFADEADAYAALVLGALRNASAIVPSVWALEVANVLLAGEQAEQYLRSLNTPRKMEVYRCSSRSRFAADAGSAPF
jgi:hypothetical protein